MATNQIHSFFKRALEGNNQWWAYLVGLIMISVGMTVGQIPLLIAVFVQMATMGMDSPEKMAEANEKLMAYDFGYFGLDANLTFFMILLTFVGVVIFLWATMKWIHKRPFASLITPLASINWKKIGIGFGIWFTISLVLEVISYYTDPSNYVWTFEWQTFIPLLILCIFVLPLQTSAEELVMRGYLMQGIPLQTPTLILTILVSWASMDVMMSMNKDFLDILSRMGIYAGVFIGVGVLFYLEYKGIIQKGLIHLCQYPIVPLILTSVIFGMLHIMNPEVDKFGLENMMVIYIGMGFMLGLITLLDESLELALGIHFGNNLFGALFVSFDGSALQTPTMFRTLEMNSDNMVTGWLIIATLFVILLQVIFKWKNWGKLFQKIEYPAIEKDMAVA